MIRFDPVIVVPVYDHAAGAERLVARLRQDGHTCILVDDGSEAGQAARLNALADPPAVTVLRLPHNRGKGAAVMTGLRHAAGHGHSHALQIDADGQHDPAEIAGFLQAARAEPRAVICGVPRYDASAPWGRRVGRWLTHVWVWVHTLSFQVRDSMCGFRVYPLEPTRELLDEQPLGERMDFDTEILVHLVWRGVPLVNRPTPVRYPQDGVSHFRMGRDNLRITAMHVRLFFGMLWRAPRLLLRRFGAAA